MSFFRRLLPLLAGLVLGGLSGCQTPVKKPDYQPLVARGFIEVRGGDAGLPLRLPVSGVSITVEPKPVLVEYDIVNAEVAKVDLGECLMLQLTPAAARDFYRLSVTHQGQRLVLCLNDRPVGVRRLDRPIADGVILVFVEAPDADLPALVQRLKRTSADIIGAARQTR